MGGKVIPSVGAAQTGSAKGGSIGGTLSASKPMPWNDKETVNAGDSGPDTLPIPPTVYERPPNRDPQEPVDRSIMRSN